MSGPDFRTVRGAGVAAGRGLGEERLADARNKTHSRLEIRTINSSQKGKGEAPVETQNAIQTDTRKYR